MNVRCKHLLLALLLMGGAPALALAGVPTDQLRQTTDKIIALVQDPALKGEAQDQARQSQMEAAVDERFDWSAMARSALGNHWRDLTEPQHLEFTGLFSDLIQKNYMTQVEGYSGEKILYKNETVDGAYGVVEVAIVTLRGTDIPVSYRMLQKGADWLVYDVSIEGVSLVNNYRSQIGSILNSGTYDTLVSRLKAKIAAASAAPSGTQPEVAPAPPQTEADVP